tara:strand:- start:60347 stop:60754 length:408 start_codon:yes stop_codon:yes gene_type:complete
MASPHTEITAYSLEDFQWLLLAKQLSEFSVYSILNLLESNPSKRLISATICSAGFLSSKFRICTPGILISCALKLIAPESNMLIISKTLFQMSSLAFITITLDAKFGLNRFYIIFIYKRDHQFLKKDQMQIICIS